MSLSSPISYAISADLTGSAAAAVSYLWDILDARFGLRAVKANQHPRITFLQGLWPTVPQTDLLMRHVSRATRMLPPVSLELDGVSSFDVDGPVLFLGVVKHESLLAVHDAMFRAAGDAGIEIPPNYHPGAWVPHCTLAIHDLMPAQVPPVRDYLRTQAVNWRCRVQNIDLLRLQPPTHEHVESWSLAGVPVAVGQTSAWQER